MQSEEKLEKLADIARRYYIEDQRQSDIARDLGVSRPLISRMLGEARALGVVEIVIHSPAERGETLLSRLRRTTTVAGGSFVPDGAGDNETNRALAKAALELLEQLGARRVGIGWGHFIGQIVTTLEQVPSPSAAVTNVCPLVGNAGFPIRNYHSNENVRVIAEGLGAAPYFLYMPALAESVEEKQLLCSTELYRQAEQQWAQMDTALVNIGNYPSTPDFASVARYGSLLQKQHACGRLLAYFYNEQGQIIHSDQDFAIQIPLETLRRCRSIVGLCSANTKPRTLRGALATGLFTHLVAGESLARAYLEEK